METKMIKRIAEQANIRFGRMAMLDGDPQGMARFVTYSEFEKFTELIVKECLNIALEQKKCVEEQKVHNRHDYDWNRARVQQSQNIVDKIKQQFGVEECD